VEGFKVPAGERGGTGIGSDATVVALRGQTAGADLIAPRGKESKKGIITSEVLCDKTQERGVQARKLGNPRNSRST